MDRRVPFQTEMTIVVGKPEGRDYAPAGYIVVDVITGNWWRKSTGQTLNTGWKRFLSGNDASPVLPELPPIDPDNPPVDGQLVIVDDRLYYYNSQYGMWVQINSGGGGGPTTGPYVFHRDIPTSPEPPPPDPTISTIVIFRGPYPWRSWDPLFRQWS